MMLTFIAGASLRAAEVDESESRVVAARRKLRSGELVVESVDYKKSEAGEFVPERTIIYDLSFDGDRLRSTQSPGHVEADGSVTTFSKEDALRTDGRIYRRDYDLSQPLAAMAMPVASVDDPTTWSQFHKYVLDPRAFGVQPVPFGVLHAFKLDGFVANPDRSSTESNDTVVDGTTVRFVTYRRQGATRRMWISPAQGWNLLKMEVDVPGQERISLACQLDTFDDVYFPRRVVYEEFDRSGTLAFKNVATVLRASFNGLLPKDRFSLTGMNIIKGSVVFDAGNQGQTYGQWDGTKIVPLGPGDTSDIAATDSIAPGGISRPKWVLYIFLVNVVVGVGFLLLYWRTRRSR
jgi:hypothetical protein